MVRPLFFIALLLSAWPGALAASEPALATRIDALQSELNAIADASGRDEDFRDHKAEYKAAFRRWFPDGVLPYLRGEMNEGDLRKLFNTYYNYLLAANQGDDASGLEAILQAMAQNGQADRSAVELTHRFYLTFRRFDDASAFMLRHPDDNLSVPPTISPAEIAAGARPVLAPREDGRILRREPVEFESSSMVVIVGHPLCHFTQNAIADISADPELADRLLSRAVWLAEPFASLTDGVIPEWNRTHADLQFRYAVNQDDWPEINYWGTPTFYFFKDGGLVRKVAGWPRDSADERKAALRAGLRAIEAEK